MNIREYMNIIEKYMKFCELYGYDSSAFDVNILNNFLNKECCGNKFENVKLYEEAISFYFDKISFNKEK